MSYEDAVTTKVTRSQALAEVRRHGASESEFFADVGDKDVYQGAEVLGWLGY